MKNGFKDLKDYIMKKIVYIRNADVYYDSRATKEIKAFLENGYQVVVLGWDRTGQAMAKCKEVFHPYSEISFRFYEQPMPHGIGMKNIRKLVGWFRWVGNTLQSIGETDIVHACDLDGALGAKRYCARHRIRLVYDIYDYYVDTHDNIPSILKHYVEKQEISIINQANLVIICTEERRIQISKSKPQNVIVVHNSPELPDVPDRKNQYDYVYCGSLGKERLFEDILKQYETNSDLRFYLAGFGTYTDEANSLAHQYQNFDFGGLLNYDQVLEKEAEAICLSAVYDPSWKNHQLCAPNKFYEALALGKPIIVCKGTGIDKIVEEYQIGKVIDYQAEQFYQAVRYFKAHPEECEKIRADARELYNQKYQWRIMREKLLKAYREL